VITLSCLRHSYSYVPHGKKLGNQLSCREAKGWCKNVYQSGTPSEYRNLPFCLFRIYVLHDSWNIETNFQPLFNSTKDRLFELFFVECLTHWMTLLVLTTSKRSYAHKSSFVESVLNVVASINCKANLNNSLFISFPCLCCPVCNFEKYSGLCILQLVNPWKVLITSECQKLLLLN